MNNNDIFKKLRVALMLRDDQIVEILELVDFRITKSELSAFFRDEKHENFVECGDQVLRNFLNGLIIHLRGTKENPKNPTVVLGSNKAKALENIKNSAKAPKIANVKTLHTSSQQAKKPYQKDKPKKKVEIVEKVKFKNGKTSK